MGAPSRIISRKVIQAPSFLRFTVPQSKHGWTPIPTTVWHLLQSNESRSNPVVVTLLIVNSDDLPPTQFATVFKAAGLDTLSFVPNASALAVSDWPTLGSMIDSGKRLVTFMDAEADFTSVSYIIDGETVLWHPFGANAMPFRVFKRLGNRL